MYEMLPLGIFDIATTKLNNLVCDNLKCDHILSCRQCAIYPISHSTDDDELDGISDDEYNRALNLYIELRETELSDVQEIILEVDSIRTRYYRNSLSDDDWNFEFLSLETQSYNMAGNPRPYEDIFFTFNFNNFPQQTPTTLHINDTTIRDYVYRDIEGTNRVIGYWNTATLTPQYISSDDEIHAACLNGNYVFRLITDDNSAPVINNWCTSRCIHSWEYMVASNYGKVGNSNGWLPVNAIVRGTQNVT